MEKDNSELVAQKTGIWAEHLNEEGKKVDAKRSLIKQHKHIKRALWKILLLSVITIGIYPLCVMGRAVKDVNACSTAHEYDKSMKLIGVILYQLSQLELYH